MQEKLYTVLLVDDEKEIVEGIVNRIAWEEIGFKLIGTAENGVDALEKISINEPDVVITDIKMPFMDGLELAKVIHQKHLSTKVVILSGFDNFEYAQEAINHGVSEYITKPITANKLIESLDKIGDELTTERAQKLNIEALQENYNTSLPIMQEQFVQKLISGTSSEAELQKLAKALDLDFLSDNNDIYIAYLVPNTDSEDSQLINFSLEENFANRFDDKYTYYISVRNDSIIVIFAGDNCTEFQLKLIDELNTFANYFHALTQIDIRGGLGSISNSYQAVASSYQEAYQAFQYAVSQDINRILAFTDINLGSREKFIFNNDGWNNITTAINTHSTSEIGQSCKKFFSGYSEHHVDDLFLELLTHLTRLTRNFDLDLDKLEVIGKRETWITFMNNIHSLKDLEQWTIEICTEISKLLEGKRSSSSENLVNNIKSYLNENFADVDLNLEAVSNKFHVSSTYLSTIFKKETGETFSAYLTSIRIGVATSLLETTSFKTYEIAESTGYSDPNYFSYVFKKERGLSPTTYRKNFASQN